jgi:hypothetical protein
MQRTVHGDGSFRRSHRARRWIVLPLVAMVVAAGACSSGASSTARSASTGDSGGAVAPQSFDDEVTPLIVTTLGSDPIPVKGSDDRFHVAYELSVLNYAPYPAVITSLDTVSSDGAVVTSRSQEQVRALTMVAPELSDSGAPATGIPAGGTGFLVLEDVYPDRASVPDSVTHRISASFSPTDGGADPRAALWPSSVTQTSGPVRTSAEDAVVIGAPLAGRGWMAGSGCCDVLNFHRNVLLPVGGVVNAGERFAIDYGAVEPDLPMGTGLSAEMQLRPGTDGTKNQDYLSYGAPILAVADATVVKVISDLPDTPPGGNPTGEGLTINGLGGNVVVLQLAPDLFAFYFHLAPDSVTVAVGDTVTKGQAIAQLGNSGNSSGPHLHFQLGRSRQAFSGENVPYVFENFVVEGTLTEAGLVPEPAPGPRRVELPLHESVVDFPIAP